MLRLLGISLLAAVVLGLLAGGRLSNLAETRFRWAWVGMAGVILQFLPVSGQVGDLALTVSFLALFVVCMANWRQPGFVLVLIGLWMNFLVITVNQGMPVSRDAIVASGQAETLSELKALDSPKHHLRRPGDELVLLGDIIGIGPPIRQAVSIGDLAALAGVAWFVIGAMRGRRAPAPAEPATEPGGKEPAFGGPLAATARAASPAEVP